MADRDMIVKTKLHFEDLEEYPEITRRVRNYKRRLKTKLAEKQRSLSIRQARKQRGRV